MGEALPGAQHRHTQHKKGGSEECEEQERARAVNMAHPSAISTPPPPWRVVETPYTGERHARGLAAGVPLARGAVVDVSPVLLFDADTYGAHLRHTALEHYVFVDRGGGGGGGVALALGAGSLFNHSSRPNCDWRLDAGAATITFTVSAAGGVAAGEELTISYGRPWWEEGKQGEADAAGPTHHHMDDEDAFLGAIAL